jgi:predicted acyltransferase
LIGGIEAREVVADNTRMVCGRTYPFYTGGLKAATKLYRSTIHVYAWRNFGRETQMATISEAGIGANPEVIIQNPAAPGQEVIRNGALDAYRGLVMLLMMAEVLRLSSVAAAYPGSAFWKILAFNQTHVEWFGCSLHDTIQPGFSFLVGAALAYSLTSRMAKGARFAELFGHALWRSLALVALGIFLRSMNHSITYFTFEDTLSQIGLGYPILFLIAFYCARPGRMKWVWAALAVILLGYWLLWALYPAAPSNFDWGTVGVSREWNAQHNFTGFAAHWNKNFNLGNRFDQWFLNLFPRENRFEYNEGGYLTLSFIPTLGTMLLGLIAGRWMRESRPKFPMKRFLLAGVTGIGLGLALHYSHVCPVVKRIWTPSWTIFSGGICFLFLAAFTWIIEVKRYKKWSFPLIVLGMNSIAAYCIAHFLEQFLSNNLRIHLGANFFRFAGPGLEPLLQGATILLLYWLILHWMYRRKLFLKI